MVEGYRKEGQRRVAHGTPLKYDLLPSFSDKSSLAAAPTDPSNRIRGLSFPNSALYSQ